MSGWSTASGVHKELRRLFDKHGPQPWTDVLDWTLKTGGTMPPKQDDIPF
jgi:hypothetical protein